MIFEYCYFYIQSHRNAHCFYLFISTKSPLKQPRERIKRLWTDLEHWSCLENIWPKFATSNLTGDRKIIRSWGSQFKDNSCSGGFRGGGARAPKFFRFHAVFGKIWQNRMLVPPPPWGVGAPPPGEILDPPLSWVLFWTGHNGYFVPWHRVLSTQRTKYIGRISNFEDVSVSCQKYLETYVHYSTSKFQVEFFTNAQDWHYCHYCQHCIPKYLQFPSLFTACFVSKCEIRCPWVVED